MIAAFHRAIILKEGKGKAAGFGTGCLALLNRFKLLKLGKVEGGFRAQKIAHTVGREGLEIFIRPVCPDDLGIWGHGGRAGGYFSDNFSAP